MNKKKIETSSVPKTMLLITPEQENNKEKPESNDDGFLIRRTLKKRELFILYQQLASLYESRGNIEDASELWRQTFPAHDPVLHSFGVNTMLKDTAASYESLLAEHRGWASLFGIPQKRYTNFKFRPYDGKRVINVAFACSFWDSQTIAFQLLPFLKQRDKKKFKIFGYGEAIPSSVYKKADLMKAVDVFRSVSHMSQDEFIKTCRKDKIDILVELNGFSPGHHFAEMASRCAPVQVNYLNYTCTSGTPNVDYMLADKISVPECDDAYFSEEVWRMPECFFCFSYDGIKLPEVKKAPHLKNGYVTFGCFGSASKFNIQLFKVWANILKKVPGSKLYLRNPQMNSEANRRFVMDVFNAYSIPDTRLIIHPGTTREGILESYGQVDVSLDTFPYCGGNTIAEAFWQGVPVVSYKGNRFSAAYGASILEYSGCRELIADSVEEYIEKAAKLAADSKKMCKYRKDLRQMVVKHGFSDPVRFQRQLEEAFEQMLVKAQKKMRSKDFWQDNVKLEHPVPQEASNLIVFSEQEGADPCVRRVVSGDGYCVLKAGKPEKTIIRSFLTDQSSSGQYSNEAKVSGSDLFFGESSASPESILHMIKSPSIDNETLLKIHREWAETAIGKTISNKLVPKFEKGRCTIGFHCGRWTSYTMKFMLLPFIKHIDRRKFRLVAFSDSDIPSDIKQLFDETCNSCGMSDAEYVKLARSKNIDAYVHLDGLLPGNRLKAVALRCAPVQISYLDYPSTTGIPNMDFILADDISAVKGIDSDFSEHIYRMKAPYCSFSYEYLALVKPGPAPHLKKKYITFACFGNNSKFNEKSISLWAEVLKKVPTAKMIVRNPELSSILLQEAMLRIFKKYGIPEKRIKILGGTSNVGIQQSYRDVDIAFDTFPYSGPSCIAESMMQGVPILTLDSDRLASVGASLLKGSGLPELVAKTEKEFVEAAVKLAADSQRLQKYRKTLPSLICAPGNFGDPAGFAVKFQKAVLDMLHKVSSKKRGV